MWIWISEGWEWDYEYSHFIWNFGGWEWHPK